MLIQTTLGCTHNKCTFCDMFREKRFRIRELEGIFSDIEDARGTFRHVGSIFLIDGNVLALKAPFIQDLWAGDTQRAIINRSSAPVHYAVDHIKSRITSMMIL